MCTSSVVGYHNVFLQIAGNCSIVEKFACEGTLFARSEKIICTEAVSIKEEAEMLIQHRTVGRMAKLVIIPPNFQSISPSFIEVPEVCRGGVRPVVMQDAT